VDEHSNQLILQEISGEKHESLRKTGLRLDIGGNSITGWVAASREPLLCNDVSQESRYYSHQLLPNIKSELAIPLLIGEKLVGVLDIQSDWLNAFRNDDMITLQCLRIR
jgi:putative methionine-R-sulfoxide reductase with GAF domain